MEFQEWAQRTSQSFELRLENYLPRAVDHPTYLAEAMRYACLGGGKRVRPLLVAAVQEYAQQLGSIAFTPHLFEAFERCAVALECIHVYSLVHDDMPCMDNDDLRRGKPTVHVAYNEATALLVGDALQTLAFEVLSHSPIAPERVIQLIQLLTQASGFVGMVGGQAIDLHSVQKSLTQLELEAMHSKKTGALLRAAVLLPAYVADFSVPQIHALERYAQAIGLAFQVIDDILDVTSTTQLLGKTAGKDQQDDKPTYVSLLGLEAASAYAQTLYQQAITALDDLGSVESLRLQQIANFIVQRQQ